MIEIAEQTYGIDIHKKPYYLCVEYFWKNREQYRWKLNELYNFPGKSKQSVHQYLVRKVNIEILVYQIRIIVQQVRKDHPNDGS
ncbi:MAG: hypothetical protein IPH96_10635 [Saprospiraceae bacterium]|nr:hypothetical protein [Saprospiraceae bacterium]